MGKFSDVKVERDKTFCKVCKKYFELNDRLIEIHVVAGVDNLVHVSDEIEYGHMNCLNNKIIIESPIRRAPTSEEIMDVIINPSHICKICKAPFKREDRITIAYVVIGKGVDPDTKAPGIMCSDQFEAVHIKCNDPKLDIGGILHLG